MPNTKKSRPDQDRQRVAANENWEVSYMREKFGVTTLQVEEAVKAVGNSREKVEEYLKKKAGQNKN